MTNNPAQRLYSRQGYVVVSKTSCCIWCSTGEKVSINDYLQPVLNFIFQHIKLKLYPFSTRGHSIPTTNPND